MCQRVLRSRSAKTQLKLENVSKLPAAEEVVRLRVRKPQHWDVYLATVHEGEKAEQIAERAIDIFKRQNRTDAVRDSQTRLDLYRRGQVYRP